MSPSSPLMPSWLATAGPLLLEGGMLAWTLVVAPKGMPVQGMAVGVYVVLGLALSILLWHLALIILRWSSWLTWVTYAALHLGLVYITGFWSYCIIRFGFYL